MKVENPKQDILPDEISFNDKDMLEDALTSVKGLVTSYGILGTEASNQTLKTEIDSLSKALGEVQRNLFNLMFEKGWYILEKVDAAKINEELTKHQQCLDNLKQEKTS